MGKHSHRLLPAPTHDTFAFLHLGKANPRYPHVIHQNFVLCTFYREICTLSPKKWWIKVLPSRSRARYTCSIEDLLAACWCLFHPSSVCFGATTTGEEVCSYGP